MVEQALPWLSEEAGRRSEQEAPNEDPEKCANERRTAGGLQKKFHKQIIGVGQEK